MRFKRKKFSHEHERAPNFAREVTPCLKGGSLERAVNKDRNK